MGDNNFVYKKGLACRFSNSSKLLLLFLLLPLALLSVFLALLGPSTRPWLYGFGLVIGSSSSSSSSSNPDNSTLSGQDGSGVTVVVGLHQTNKGNENFAIVSQDSVLKVSSPAPQLGDLPHGIQQVNATRENSLPDAISGINQNGTSASESFDIPIEAERPIERTNLERIEGGLQKARAIIKEANSWNQTKDPDYVPVGPMYWNAKVFHRSYLEMEKQFKVFVYEEGEPPVFHNGPCKSIYSMEGNFIHRMEIDGFRTKDPEKAHVYFLPFSVAMMVQFVYVRDSHDFGPIRRTVNDYVNLIAGKYPYWNRSLGADHFMLACHDWGPETSFSVPYLGKNSIRALCNANTSERFNPMKDVSFPEINLQTGTIHGFVGGPSPSKRPILAFFAGGLHGPIRPILLEHWENKDDDLKVHRYLQKGVSYYEMMRKSKYCLCPSGYEVASPRVVEAIYTGCVPVLISEHYVPPFSDVLNWKSFSVEVPVRDIPNLKKILTDISPRQYIRMQRRVRQVRRHFEVNSPPKRYDVFHMILHSIWLRRLNVRIQNDQFAITS